MTLISSTRMMTMIGLDYRKENGEQANEEGRSAYVGATQVVGARRPVPTGPPA